MLHIYVGLNFPLNSSKFWNMTLIFKVFYLILASAQLKHNFKRKRWQLNLYFAIMDIWMHVVVPLHVVFLSFQKHFLVVFKSPRNLLYGKVAKWLTSSSPCFLEHKILSLLISSSAILLSKLVLTVAPWCSLLILYTISLWWWLFSCDPFKAHIILLSSWYCN